jgi:hypothetical protein
MNDAVRLFAAVLVIVAALLLKVQPGKAATEVDLALVLAVDISGSMDPEEQRLQREGFVEAFRDPEVHDAIRKGMLGRISVVYAEWAGYTVQHVVVPWTVIEGPEDAMQFAERLALTPIRRGPRTSVSGAIDFGVRLLGSIHAAPLRRVIDISGDGVNGQGRSVIEARDEAVAQGITINGLPLMLNRPSGSWNVEGLDLYFRDCVIGGSGAFMIPVRERQQFAQAIRTKIIREVAGGVPEPFIVPVQAQPTADCRLGENTGSPMWRN